MKFAMVMVALGYIVIVAMFGTWGLLAAALHLGHLFLFGPRR